MDKYIAEQLYDPKTKRVRMPKSWTAAMISGIAKRSDVSRPQAAGLVRDIWRRLSKKKQVQIATKAKKGKKFLYDLPLPEDHSTKGSGTVRVVKPFDLAEVQVNVTRKAYNALVKTGLFQRMKRQDGSIALVKRCKAKGGNVNIFVDR